MRTSYDESMFSREAAAIRYAGWYDDDDIGLVSCELCGSVEDVSYCGPTGDVPLCLDCVERPYPSVWAPYYEAVYGAELD